MDKISPELYYPETRVPDTCDVYGLVGIQWKLAVEKSGLGRSLKLTMTRVLSPFFTVPVHETDRGRS